MAFNAHQKAALDLFCSRQFELKPGGQLGEQVGGLTSADGPVNLGSAIDSLQTREVVIPFTLPAITTGATTVDIPCFKAHAAGSIVSVEIVPSTVWAAGNNVGDKYLTSVRKFSGTPADVTFAHDLISGVAAAGAALLPSGANVAMLTSGQTIAIAVSGAIATFTNQVNFVNAPTVGDFISITSAATNVVGAGVVNPGVYRVTSITSTKIVVATKVFGTNPVAVSAVSAGAGDVAGFRLISQTETTFVSGDLLGVRVIVPIDTTTPVDVSAVKFLAVIRYRTTV